MHEQNLIKDINNEVKHMDSNIFGSLYAEKERENYSAVLFIVVCVFRIR